MTKKTISIIALVLLVTVSLIGYIAYSFDFDRAVQVNLSNIYIDDAYLKEQSVPYDTTGKKVISCDFEIKNYSAYIFDCCGIFNDDIIPLYGDQCFEFTLPLSSYDKTIVCLGFLADENDDMEEIKKQLMNSRIEIKRLKEDGNYDDFSLLYVDKIKD